MVDKFNSDLLISEADQKMARRVFPAVFCALDNPDLRDVFEPYDNRANLAKALSRRWGMSAVWLAAVALLLGAGEILYRDLPKTTVYLIAATGGLVGLISVFIGVFGIMFRKRKMSWLADRFATERIRSFYFQFYIMEAAGILAGAQQSSARENFLTHRNEQITKFKEKYLADASQILHELIHSNDMEDGLFWGDTPPELDAQAPHLDEYLQAYVALRFQYQLDYCNFVLSEKPGVWRGAAVNQAKILGAIVSACVMALLALYGIVFLGSIVNVDLMKNPLFFMFPMWAAIIALSAYALEQGIQPEREIERMRQYRISLKRIFDRFNNSRTPKEKLSAMTEMEKLSYEEMVLFLKCNYDAEFVM